TTWNGDHPRGSSALRGALDTELKLELQKHQIILSCVKQKDADPFEPISLTRQLVPLSDGKSSLVLVPSLTPIAKVQPLKRREPALVLVEQALDDGMTAKEWQTASEGLGVRRSTFYNNRLKLLGKNVRQEGDTYFRAV